MPNTSKQSVWNKLEFPSNFDKKRRAIKLGQHRERLLFTNREIDNDTPRCYHEYKTMRQRNKKHKEKEVKIHKERRERLSMLSPYSKHSGSLNVSMSCSSLQKSSSSTMSLSHSISPNVSFLMRQQNKTKRKKNMKYIQQNEKKSKQKQRKSKKMMQKFKKIESENAKMKKRLNSIRPSDYMENIQKHWTLHSHIRHNMQKYKKSEHCPDIIYSNAYRKKKQALQKSRSNSVPAPNLCNRYTKLTKTKKKHKLPKL